MPLPILTTADDVKAIVSYLKTKPTGATLAEATVIIPKPLDRRKLTAYLVWGVVARDGDRLKLAPRGWEIARQSKPDQQVYREIIDSIAPYRAALEWAHHQGFESITNVDVAALWHDHHANESGTSSENTIKDQAVCFFRVAEAAGLGTVIVGRSGNATRLRLDRNALHSFIEAGPSTPPWQDASAAPLDDDRATPSTAEIESTPTRDARMATPLAATPPSEPTTEPPGSNASGARPPEALRVFISHGKNTELIEQVETMLGLADIPSEVAVKEETAAIPVPEKVFAAMRRCGAAIIIVSVDEGHRDASGNYSINENVLIEIGASFVLYDKKVVLLWDKRLPVPSNLQGLYRCEFEGDDLNWGAGMKLMKAIKGFKA